ncbi:unnamed protein product [Ceutorhynchus assimilis]|uniref:LIM zinc-binding domain-containing protein n=1 Tax=Ceutorhynchus assimilis TaxID=467358 RepID=A0A9N9QQN8_9CUCU|nr:unnamed protein product [Ceutorhynchus assimilis]
MPISVEEDTVKAQNSDASAEVISTPLVRKPSRIVSTPSCTVSKTVLQKLVTCRPCPEGEDNCANIQLCFPNEEKCPNIQRTVRSCSCIPNQNEACFTLPLPREVANYYNRAHMKNRTCYHKPCPNRPQCQNPCCAAPKPKLTMRTCMNQSFYEDCRTPPRCTQSPCPPQACTCQPCRYSQNESCPRAHQCSSTPKCNCSRPAPVQWGPPSQRCPPKPKGCPLKTQYCPPKTQCWPPKPQYRSPKPQACSCNCKAPPDCCSSGPKYCVCGRRNPCNCKMSEIKALCTICCKRCNKRVGISYIERKVIQKYKHLTSVYAAEKIQVTAGAYHTNCFTCYCCKKYLDVKTLYEGCGEIYCKRTMLQPFLQHSILWVLKSLTNLEKINNLSLDEREYLASQSLAHTWNLLIGEAIINRPVARHVQFS